MNYSIITPTKNEGKFIEETIKSIISQKILPKEWIIMDDGSSDQSEQIIEDYLKEYPFIKYIKLENYREEYRNRGGRVASIINYGDSLSIHKVDIIAKIDADTSFEKKFFSDMLVEFEKDDSLGVASGHRLKIISLKK